LLFLCRLHTYKEFFEEKSKRIVLKSVMKTSNENYQLSDREDRNLKRTRTENLCNGEESPTLFADSSSPSGTNSETKSKEWTGTLVKEEESNGTSDSSLTQNQVQELHLEWENILKRYEQTFNGYQENFLDIFEKFSEQLQRHMQLRAKEVESLLSGIHRQHAENNEYRKKLISIQEKTAILFRDVNSTSFSSS